MSGERRRWILAGIGVLLASTVLPLSAPTSALTPGVESVSDPRNDVANGGGDIVSASAVPKADGTLTVTIEVDDYEDPLISRAWTTGLAAATWEFDTNGDGNVDHTRCALQRRITGGGRLRRAAEGGVQCDAERSPGDVVVPPGLRHDVYRQSAVLRVAESGFVTLFPCGSARPGSSTLN